MAGLWALWREPRFRPYRAFAAAYPILFGLVGNYGEAGAVDRYGPELGLPRAYSGHNSYWWWGRPSGDITTVVAVGFDRPYLTQFLHDVHPAGTLHNGAGVDDDEEGAPVWICTGPRAPWSVLWPELRHYG